MGTQKIIHEFLSQIKFW